MKVAQPRPSPQRPPTQRSTSKPKARSAVSFAPPGKAGAHRTVLYGPGGIGKSTLAAAAPGPVAFLDLDDSLRHIGEHLGEYGHKPLILEGIDSWQAMRDALHAPGWDSIRTIVVDSTTKAEEYGVADTLKMVPHEKGGNVKRLEDYGYGKGYMHVYETFLQLLGDLDVHVREGRNVILVCHDCTSTVPNPQGEDWIRYEPRLQTSTSGKASIRLRTREWADHVLFFGYDIDVKKGKGKGCETRTLYPFELPHCMAKTRTHTAEPMIVEKDTGAGIWDLLIGKGGSG